jgi:hypothetical protein
VSYLILLLALNILFARRLIFFIGFRHCLLMWSLMGSLIYLIYDSGSWFDG